MKMIENLNVNERLNKAAASGDLYIVKSLIKQGADINFEEGSPLWWAGYNQHLEVVKYFVSKGADIQQNNGEALRWAKSNKNTQVVDYLESIILKEKRLKELDKV